MKTKHDTYTLSVAQLAKLMVEHGIYLDEAFQSNTRWTILMNQEYMRSIIEGRAITPITLGNISDILNVIERRFGPTHEDYTFFKNLQNEGYIYITIDGNNRDNCVLKFVNNEFPLALGKYEIEHGNTVEFQVNKDNKYYEDLDPDVRNYIDNVILNFIVITQSTRKGLAEVFTNVNKGLTLNSQEKRNAIACQFGNLVRATTKKYAKGFGRIYSKIKEKKEVVDQKKINRRYPDELVVKAAVICAYGISKGLNGNALDEAYGDGTAEVVCFNRVDKIIGQLTKFASKFGKEAWKADGRDDSNMIDFIILLDYLDRSQVIIEDDKAFYNWFTESQLARTSSDEVLYTGRKGTNVRTYAGLLRASGTNFLKIREEKLINSVSEVPDGILTFRDTNRNYDPKIRYVLWKRQDGKCAITEKYIEPRHILNGQVTHVDHHEPHRHGGETSLENARLVYAEANLEKGATLLHKVSKQLPV